MVTTIQNLQEGNLFITNEVANITVHSGFIIKLPEDKNNIFTVVKVNEKSVVTTCETVNPKFVNSKGHVVFKIAGTTHHRSIGNNISVILI